MKTRLFIGNLAENVTKEDLQEKFDALLSSHKNEADVGNVEVRCKNDSNYFGFVDIHLKNGATQDGGKIPIFIRKCIDLMNNTKWKGSLIKVQVAKESFIDKLKREREEQRGHHTNDARNGSVDTAGVDKNSEKGRNQQQAAQILHKINKTRDRRNGENKFKSNFKEGNHEGKYDFEIVGKTEKLEHINSAPCTKTVSPPKELKKNQKRKKTYHSSDEEDGRVKQATSPPSSLPSSSPPKISSIKPTKAPEKKKNDGKNRKSSKKTYSSSDDDDEGDHVKDGIPKFKGLLSCYPNGTPPPQSEAVQKLASVKETPEKKKNDGKNKKSSKRTYSSSDNDDEDDQVKDGIPKFKGILSCYPDGMPPVQSQSVQKLALVKETPKKQNDEEPEADLEESEPLPIQQKLISLAFDPNSETRERPAKRKKIEAGRQDSHFATGQEETSAVHFKKNKQQKSDEVRLQSLEKLKSLKEQQKSLIKSALSSVTAAGPIKEQRKVFDEDNDNDEDVAEAEDGGESTRKKSKMTLFDDDDEDSDMEREAGDQDLNDENAFKVKKQFEGAQGQKLLELQTRWGNDDRFKIDDRFKESENEESGNEEQEVEKEKEKQLSILTDLLGKDFNPSLKDKSLKTKSKSAPASLVDPFASVILPRYDPENEKSSKLIEQKVSRSAENSEGKQTSAKEKKNSAVEPEEEVKPIRSTEPVTYKVASNLKEMFTSDSTSKNKDESEEKAETTKPDPKPAQSGFSLLATFGKASDDEDDDEDEKRIQKKTESSNFSAGPRSFWQSNPFRYDSSDDEDDEKSKQKDKSRGDKANEKEPEKVSDIRMKHKERFFFKANDKRFEGLEDFFLKDEDFSEKKDESSGQTKDGDKKSENTAAEAVEDFSVKRQELKAIIKAKIRNSKRKDEKRTLAIKRALRKRKRKAFQRKKAGGS